MSADPAVAGNYVTSGGEGDPEFVAEQLAERQAEQTGRDREIATHTDTKRRLEQRVRDQRRTVSVLGEPVEFRPPGVGVSREAIRLRQRALDGDAEAEADLVDLVFETLADHALDEEMDADWWGQFQLGTIQSVFEELVMNDVSDAERERIESFRDE